MPADRVLIEIVTAANMAGVKEAEAGLLGFNPLALAAGLALGGLVVAGKDAIRISREHFAAQANLNNAIANSARVITPSVAAQQKITKAIQNHKDALAALIAAQTGKYIPATHLTELQVMRLQDAEARVAATTGQKRINAQRRLAELQVEYGTKVHGASVQVGNLAGAQDRVAKTAKALSDLEKGVGATIHDAGVKAADVQASLTDFLKTNRDFISSQNDVITAYASLIREGVKVKDLNRLMTLALNIQSTEGGTLAESVMKIQSAEVGRNKGLATAVGLTLNAVPATATYAAKLKIVEGNLKALERAYGKQKPVLDPLTIATNHLKTDWELMAEKYGPELVLQIAGMAEAIDKGLPSWLDWAGKVASVASQLGTLLDKMDLFWPAIHAIQHAFDPAGMPVDPGGSSVYAQQHAGQPNYSAAAHQRGSIAGGGGHNIGKGGHARAALHLHGPVTVITHAENTKTIKEALRRSDRALA